MNFIKIISLVIITFCFQCDVYGQLPWTEDFGGASGSLEINNETVTWNSTEITISGCNTVNVSIDLTSSTNLESPSDISEAWYNVDGAGWVLFYTNTGNIGTATATTAIPTGTSLLIRVTATTNHPQEDIYIENVEVSGSCPTITAGAITYDTGTTFDVDCSGTTDGGSIAFNSTGTYSGNTYTVEMSDASGDFLSPTVVGTLTSDANSGSIGVTIPSGTATGSGYVFRIVSSSPIATSSISTIVDITQGCNLSVAPHIKSVIINSCQVDQTICPEGDNEIIFGTTGDYSVEATSSNLILSYGSTLSTTYTYTDILVTNTTKTSLLNTEGGCTGTFIEGTGETMPPNSSYMVINTDICTDALDWSSLCNSGPIYVIYSNDGTWSSGGNFLNSSGSTRYFQSSITDTDGTTHDINYSYNSSDLTSHADGDYTSWGAAGGAPINYGNNGCTIDPVVLSSEISNFRGEYKNKQIVLDWKSITEFNNDYFTIYHSIDGFEWNSIGATPGHGNSISELYYGMIHERPESGLNYYQLHSTDFDGTTYNKATIAVNTDISFAYFNITNNTIELEKETDLEIYSTDGRLVYKNAEAKNVLIETKGMFILVDLKTNQTERIMVH